MTFKAHKMAPTSVTATLNVLTQPKSSPSIDPSQSNYLSSKMSFHIYGNSDFVNPENIAAFLAYFQQIRTHSQTVILLRSHGAKRLRMRDEDLTAICDRTKKKYEASISTRAFPLKSPSKNKRIDNPRIKP